MADISQSRSDLEALRGVLNHERVEEIHDGAGMRKAFEAAKKAIEAYEAAKAELRFADAGTLSEAASVAVESAWDQFRKLEVGWAFDQVAKLEGSLANLANGKRHPYFDVRRFFYSSLRREFQAANDKLAFIKSWTPEKGASDVLRRHVRAAWAATNAAWDANDAIERAGGLPGSWLFRGPILATIEAEAIRRAKAANEAAAAEAAEGQKPLRVKPTVYTWEGLVHSETNFQTALPEGETAAATRERLAAQLYLGVRLDVLKLTAEVLYATYKAAVFSADEHRNGSGVASLTGAEIALIAGRFEAMEAPKEASAPKPAAFSAEAASVRPDPEAIKAAAAEGDSIARALVNLDDRGDGKDEPLSLDDPRFKGFLTVKAEAAGESFADFVSLLASRPAEAQIIEAEYRASLAGGNGKPKPLSPKKVQKTEGKAAAAAKNGDGKKPAPRRSLFGRKKEVEEAAEN